MYFLGRELEKRNNNIHYFFIHHHEIMDKNLTSKNTYFYFKDKIKNENIHDVKDINEEFLKNKTNIKIDYNRLKEIEEKYTYFRGLNQQILSSQATSTPYHDRFYYPQSTFQENLYWLTLNYNKTESVLDLINPDYIFDIDTGEIQRSLINEVAHHRRIGYINIEHARYESFIVPTFNLGLKPDQYFVNAYNKNKQNLNLKEYINEIEEYRSRSVIIPEMYKEHNENSHNFKITDAIKYIIFNTYKFVKSQIYYFKNNKNRIKLNTALDSHVYKKILWKYVCAIRKWYLYSNFNKYFKSPKDEKYIYMPLHVIPESTTFVKSPMYIDEINLIEAISKSLPISWKLYIKEHPAMIGERSIQFYKRVNKLHNVKFVKINFYKDPKPWIQKSLAVITIVGSSALEASMLSKPAIVFGNVCYNVLSNVRVTNSFEELEMIFKLIKNDNWPNKNNNDECAAYLNTIKDKGINLDMWTLLKLSSKKINSELLSDDEAHKLKKLNDQLINFYDKAVEIYDGLQINNSIN
tara:strand:+ start:781 stop:2346 length:1566 start_codon:yes stop_codon:yes gene_type:complete